MADPKPMGFRHRELLSLRDMPRESFDLEMEKVISEEQPVPHPESPVKEVHSLASRHIDKSDVTGHHVDLVSYHEPLPRRHHHRHHTHHRHRHHHHRDRDSHEVEGPVEQGGEKPVSHSSKDGHLGPPGREGSGLLPSTQTSMYVPHSPSFEALAQRSKEGTRSPSKTSPAKQVYAVTQPPRPGEPDAAEKEGEDKRKTKDKHSHHHHHRRHHHHRHHHHRHRHVDVLPAIPTEMEEALTLPNRDLEEMATHRLQDEPGVHRRVIKPDYRRASSATGSSVPPLSRTSSKKPRYDHSPHDVFVELEELHVGDNAELEWRETARWVKYEEDVQPEADRWGKPHVASLSFHSLLELRKCLEDGTVLLDLEANGLEDISQAVVENMIVTDQLDPKYREVVLKALLLRHVHQSDPHSHHPSESVPAHRKSLAPATDEIELERRGTIISMVDTGPLLSPRSHSVSSPVALDSDSPRLSDMHRRPTLRVEHEAPHDPHLESDLQQLSLPQVDPAGHVPTNGADSLSSGIGSDGDTLPAQVRLQRRSSFREAMLSSEGGLKDLSRLLQQTLENPQQSEDSQPLPKSEQHLLEHLPTDVEGTTVLVGALDFLQGRIIAFVRLAKGQLLGHVTEVPIPVRFMFIMLGPPAFDFDGATTYHEIGRSISTLMADDVFHATAYRAESREDLLHAINLFLDDSLVLPPGKWDKDLLLPAIAAGPKKRRHTVVSSPKRKLDKSPLPGGDGDDPLAQTGRFCGGLVKDLRRLSKRYVSDFRDAGRLQVLTTAIFMFFAAIAPVITFGGLLGQKTESSIGLAEMLIATSFGGMIFASVAAQPLMLVGPTGPLLVFEEVIYSFCTSQSINYYEFRFWTGIFVFLFLFIVVAFDLSLFIKKFTRFTEEVFATLIGFIFIFEALKSIFKAFSDHPLSVDYCEMDVCLVSSNTTMAANVTSSKPMNEPNAALLYLLLVVGTFCVAYGLRVLRYSRYLSKEIRRTLSDFGILITIIFFVIVAHFLFGSAYSEKVAAPSGFSPTNKTRPWVIPAGENLSTGWIFASIVPALLVAFLIFVETQVTALIVGSPDHKLRKGPGFHWNLFIVALLVIVCSVLGLPWLCGTPVPSLSHTSSLLLYEKSYAPGEKPKIVGAVEQRVSNILIHALIALTLSPGVTTLLQQVPIAVLFGVFLYLGVISILRLQFVNRVVLLVVPPKHHPDSASYVQRVRTKRMHIYTLVQLTCLGILIVFKQTQAALVFPIMILLMVPLRNYIVSRYFSESELEALDPHGDDDFVLDVDYESLDEYEATHLPV